MVGTTVKCLIHGSCGNRAWPAPYPKNLKSINNIVEAVTCNCTLSAFQAGRVIVPVLIDWLPCSFRVYQ